MFSSTNIYLTPAHSRGFIFHQDVHAVMVLQLEGEKHWRLYTPPDQRSFPYAYGEESPEVKQTRFYQDHELSGWQEFEFTLRAGDTLVIPRGGLVLRVCVASGCCAGRWCP